jgi:two-component system chemotaxis response regulator CheB
MAPSVLTVVRDGTPRSSARAEAVPTAAAWRAPPSAGIPAMHKLIVIGTSAGGVSALAALTAALPSGLPATVLIVMHIGARTSLLPEILQKLCPLPVRHARDGESLLPGQVLIAPPDRHLTVERHLGQPRARLWHGPKENHTRPAIDPLFRSAAQSFDGHVIGAILTGYLDDGTAGLQAVKACGGYAIVQDPDSAQAPDMPASALNYVAADQVLPLHEIGPALAALAGAAPQRQGQQQPPEWLDVENRYVRGEAGMDDLWKIGTPSGFTCPDCHGALWKIDGAAPLRYRCHTGHSFSARVLSELQDLTVENALWASLRALQEQVRMEQGMLREASARQDEDASGRHLGRVEQLQADIETLMGLLFK